LPHYAIAAAAPLLRCHAIDYITHCQLFDIAALFHIAIAFHFDISIFSLIHHYTDAIS